jgi:DNA-binding CsgD family transcriptional regulator
VNPDDWLKRVRAIAEVDLSEPSARLAMPTLVLHQRDLWRLEASARLAAAIPNARIVHIDGPPPFGDALPALEAVDIFVAGLRAGNSASTHSQPFTPHTDGLSLRELEVLRLLAAGKSNPEIAKELFITRNTVQNHVSSILIKTNLTNRAQAAVYARDHGLA